MDRILFFLIDLCFVWIDDNIFGSSEVHINSNITAEVNSNDIRLECSFTLGEGDAFYSTALTAENATTDKFIEIAGYLRNTKPLFTPFGMDLLGNKTTLIHFDENHTMFTLAFDNVTCRHERRYKCLLLVTSSTSVLPRLFESDAIWISVTVPPSKPEMCLSGSERNNRSVSIMQKNVTHKQDFIEGDNISFMCEGDVGRPEGRFLWQKIYANDRKFYYSNTLTETIPESCSYEGNSTLTIQVTVDDNQAIIRCIIYSEVSHVSMYEDSGPLRIHFQVRIPVLVLIPNKTVFWEGDSVQLHCKANGNPIPSYSWTKSNSSEEIIVDNDILVINKAKMSDSGLYTCATSNVVDGTAYSESISTYLNIATIPSRTTSRTTGSDNRKVVIAVSTVCGSIILVLCVIGFFLIWNKYRKSDDRSADYVNTTQQQQLSLYEGVGQNLDVHNYEQMARTEHLYINTNLHNVR